MPVDDDATARWNRRYLGGDAPREPAEAVVELLEDLPPGRALDVAGGAGRHAIWLAQRGWDVLLVDAAEIGLRLAGERAHAAGATLKVLQRNLMAEPLPTGRFDLVVVVAFLDRDVLDAVPDALVPGGRLVFVQPTTTNLERHDRPPRRFLLEPGEMARIGDRLGLEVEVCDEGWWPDGRHQARLRARRPVAARRAGSRPAARAPMRS